MLIWCEIGWWIGRYEMRLKRMVWLCSDGMNEDVVLTVIPTLSVWFVTMIVLCLSPLLPSIRVIEI